MQWTRALRQIQSDPLSVLAHLMGKLYLWRLALKRGLTLGRSAKIVGWPIIDIRGNARVVIGNNVVLNSRNRGYFGQLLGPVKLFVDNPGATIRIGDNTRIHGACLHAYRSIEVGANCLIAGNTTIVDSDGHEAFPDRLEDRLTTRKQGEPVVIGDNVWIGMNCIILKGTCIGTGAVVGAGSVVRCDIPPHTIAIGNPAVVVKTADRKRLCMRGGQD